MVRSGETLVSIAQSVWGDASLWYKLAEANGLARSDSVSAGQSLILPSALSISHNNAATFKPYDAGKALGDIQPGAPKPPTGKKGCGVVGQILSTVVAIAATHLLGGIPGNLVSQAFNNLIGTQKGFSFKSLAIAAITSGITAGLEVLGNVAAAAQGAAAAGKAVTGFGKLFMAGNALNGLGKAAVFLAKGTVLSNVARAVTTSALSQGVQTLSGLQDRFSFKQVAIAGVQAGVTSAVSARLGTGLLGPGLSARGGIAAVTVSGMAGGIAAAGTRSLIEGTDFGDNLIAVLPDILATALATAAHSLLARAGAESDAGAGGGMGGPDGDEDTLVGGSNSGGTRRVRFAGTWIELKTPSSVDPLATAMMGTEAYNTARNHWPQAEPKNRRENERMRANYKRAVAAEPPRTESDRRKDRQVEANYFDWKKVFDLRDRAPAVPVNSDTGSRAAAASSAALDKEMAKMDQSPEAKRALADGVAAYQRNDARVGAIAQQSFQKSLGEFYLVGAVVSGVATTALLPPTFAGSVATEGTKIYFGVMAATGGTVSLGLGEVIDAYAGRTATPGERIGRFVGGATVVVGALPALSRFSVMKVGAISGGVGGATTSVVTQKIDDGSISVTKTLYETAEGAALGAAVSKFGGDKLNIPGLTQGRGNVLSSYNSQMTRLSKGDITRISPLVSAKAGVANVLQDFRKLYYESVLGGTIPDFEAAKKAVTP
jgi:LysM domain